MPKFTWEEIITATGAKEYLAPSDRSEKVTDVVTDTRRITPGTLFVALKGEKFNGEDFAKEALAKGAAGVMVSLECPAEKLPTAGGTVVRVADTLKAYQDIAGYYRQKFALPLVAITGSNGKTTTKDLTAAALSPLGEVLKTQGNFNNEIGLPLTLLGLKENHAAAVVEIGMRGLHQIEALAKVARPTIGVVTNVGETHMELLGSMDNIARAKGEMVEAINPGGTVILNADNEYVAKMTGKAKPGVKILTFGFSEKADVRGENVVTEEGRTAFTATYQGQSQTYTLPLVGQHNVSNALASIAVALSLNVKPAEIAAGLAQAAVSHMRLECAKMNDYLVVNDAYNASPMSMQAAIETVSQMATGRKIAVMGDMLELGKVAVEAHQKVGRQLAEHQFAVVVTRGEMGAYIAQAAKEAGVSEVYDCPSHEAAAKVLRETLRPGDTVLFKGSRGMAMDKIIELL
ncbi:MAG: UDP-N-acetylmuramoyl-tripeptide--D-alanyl-D-alanine ligase [Selenomonadaceae bacterium]|nr:UDP-N-acetylmuramoyl-tripeptide--D-alanyl-D-alanine ligase [Selenomonadaceae bacterium]